MFTKILIANRGEIACRVIRCSDEKLRPVAHNQAALNRAAE